MVQQSSSGGRAAEQPVIRHDIGRGRDRERATTARGDTQEENVPCEAAPPHPRIMWKKRLR